MRPFPFPFRRHIGACALSLLVAALAGPALAGNGAPGLFETREIFSTDLGAFKKWDIVVARAARQYDNTAQFCRDSAPAGPCVAETWKRLVAELRTLPLRERAERANAVLNRLPYVTSEANWHDPNHWETPFEFLERGGQCQDYAIAKFMALAATGVPEEDLRVVVVHDRRTALDHAIAIVYVDGEPLVLDNQIEQVVPSSRIDWYAPYYSINLTGWWYHVPSRPPAAARLARSSFALSEQ